MGHTKGVTMYVVDTSILMAIAQRATSLDSLLDALASSELYVTKPVLEELVKLAQGTGERARHAQWILSNLVDKVVKVVEVDCEAKRFDDRIICSVKKIGATLITMDKEMAKKGRAEGVGVIVVRKFGKRLEVFTSA